MIRFQNVTFSYAGYAGEETANSVSNIDLMIPAGQTVLLTGPSGCGKTTTLRIIAGLESPDAGRVILGGQDVTEWEPNRRSVNTVFQNYALFPHMNVFNNIAYGLKLKRTPKEQIKTRVEEMLELVQLPGYGKRMPTQLSGGQRQALTLLMATLTKPRLLLLDEHTAALDPKTASKVLNLTEEIVDENHLTTLMVTHNMNDAIRLGNRLIMMHEGHVIYDVAGDEKKSLTVADLLQKFEEVSGGELANDRMLLS